MSLSSRWFHLPLAAVLFGGLVSSAAAADHVRSLQAAAWESGTAAWGHWGSQPGKYSGSTKHSNRLIPVYTFGVELDEFLGEKSIYRDADGLTRLYGRVPEATLNPAATWFDQTDLYRLQQAAVAAGKKYVVLVVFDGMDWQTTWAAAIHKTQTVSYREGRGGGLLFQDYRGVGGSFGYCVTSAFGDDPQLDVNAQTVLGSNEAATGGYDARRGGDTPWTTPVEPDYLLGKSRELPHTVTDSASSATSLTAGIKTYNAAINVAPDGSQAATIAHDLQRDRGFAIGVVTSVPISHATPAAAYAQNVHRDDYQDLTRDLLGLASASHRQQPLVGVDVLIGAGWGVQATKDAAQGDNFVPGNRYLADTDLQAIDQQLGGRYVVAQRTAGEPGGPLLQRAAERAVGEGQRLFGLFGAAGGHLPFQTADGDFNPTRGVRAAESYTPADVTENPTLAEMTHAALTVLQQDEQGFWLMVEAGDVDWANHDNNIDNSIGTVLSGDAAFGEIVRWAEARQCWDQTAVILTADHGHYLVLADPSALVRPTGQ